MKLALVVLGASWLAAGPRDIANYRITAALDPRSHTVRGAETLTWKNDSPQPVRELQFHLYMNAFRDRNSTFLREAGAPAPEDPGWIRIRHVRLPGGPDLAGALRLLQPDDGNTADATVAALSLPAPLPPGSSLSLEIDFETRLPRIVARTGYASDFYFVGQWFPKVGVWRNGAWNCHQFHALSEFYADFGSYDVTLNVPADYQVGATGALQSRTEDRAKRTATWRYLQDAVHDFAWTASPRFLRRERIFDPARSAGLTPVRMILLMQPEHARQIERHFRILESSLKWYGLRYGRYPYATITLVDPSWAGREAGGMEYPTLITTGTHWLAAESERDPEDVTAHEFGHQYFYGIVASNEFEEPWLDEGFTTYTSGKLLDTLRTPRLSISWLGIPWGAWMVGPAWNSAEGERAVWQLLPRADALARRSWDFASERSYVVNAYARASLVLNTLEKHLGEAVMARVMRTYFERWSYRHPTTRDFQQVAQEVSGQNLDWFFNQFVYDARLLDYRVDRIERHRAADGRTWDSSVKVWRGAEAAFPVRIRFRFADGQTAERTWDGHYLWTRFDFHRPSPLDSAEVDPEGKVPLDVNRLNNRYQVEPQRAAVAGWSGALLYWLESALLSLGGLL